MDNYDQFLRHQAKKDKMLENLPKCHQCGEPIQDEIIITVKGKDFCEDCAKYVLGIELRPNI